MAYSAYVLTSGSRLAVLERFPPKFSDVICHHVTERFGVHGSSERIPAPAEIKVVGYTSDSSLEALVVTVNGNSIRPDGLVYHITLSLDRLKGRKPVDSNRVITLAGWCAVEPLSIEAPPQLRKVRQELFT